MESTSLRPLSILLVITELDPGGAEKCLCDLATFLAARGHRVKVFALGPEPVGLRATLVERLRAASVAVEFASGRRMTHFPRIALRLRTAVADFRPDIVQSMLWHANVLCAIVCHEKNTVLIGGVRVSDPSRWRNWIQGLLSFRFRALVCVSRDVARWCRTRERITEHKLEVIANGIQLPTTDLAKPSWRELGLPADAKVLLVMGRLEKQKGCFELLQRADELLGRLPEHHLLFMGLGSQEQLLRTTAARCKKAQRIHFVGWQPEGAKWMRGSEALLLPARYEGMPNVVLEAMAHGIPFVAFDVDGVQELLIGSMQSSAPHQITAIDDWTGFIDRVVKFASNSELRRAIGNENRQQISEHFQLHAQLLKYEALYYRCRQENSTNQ